MSFLLEGSVKAERESVQLEVVAGYFNISTVMYVLSYLQPKCFYSFIRVYLLVWVFYCIYTVRFSLCTQTTKKGDTQNFNNFRPKIFFKTFEIVY